jgi:hypothetical protein
MNKKIITLSIVCLLTVLQLANAQKVGVGTQAPAYILTVKDTMGAGAGIGIAHVSDDDSVAIGTYVDDFSAYIQTHTATNLSFATDNAPAQMTLQKITGNPGYWYLNTRGKAGCERQCENQRHSSIAWRLTCCGKSTHQRCQRIGQLAK